jgi:predicted kinase
VADRAGRLGSPAQLRETLLDNLNELEGLVDSCQDRAAIDRLRTWAAAAFDRLQPVLARRLADGRVRECHGDLHLGNVTLIDGRSTVFDAIEFNDDFRWIDVISDVAFLAMDLQAHGLSRLANRFVNGYLELSGDYDGVAVLDYYAVQRALVRAKVKRLRAAQLAARDDGDAGPESAAARRYIDLALHLSRCDAAPAALMLTHGLSGSGKSTLTQDLLEAAGAIRIRADVERKRLAGGLLRGGGSVNESTALYGADMTAATYARLASLAALVLISGRHAILDATFLKQAHRDAARQLAARHGLRCVILDFDAEVEVLRQRLRERAAAGIDPSDADEAVLAGQMRSAEPLQPDEQALVGCGGPPVRSEDGAIRGDWTRLLAWLDSGDGAPVPTPPGHLKGG